jgi:hypothetical protein
LDPSGDYRLVPGDDVPGDDLGALPAGSYDLVLAAFTFDNIVGRDNKLRILRDLGRLLNREGKLVLIVSRPEIYTHEWASFSTNDFPENQAVKSGDKVRIIVTDHADLRPIEDILWTDQAYLQYLQCLQCLQCPITGITLTVAKTGANSNLASLAVTSVGLGQPSNAPAG